MTAPLMDPDKYAALQSQILLLAAAVDELPDLTAFLRAIDRADSLGPILDPTLWMRSGKRMAHIRAIAAALAQAQWTIHQHRQLLQELVLAEEGR